MCRGGQLANRASEGPNEEDAKFLRVTAKNVNVSMVNNFRIHDLTARYDRSRRCSSRS